MEEKIALAACSGMSPNGLVARVAVHDLAIDDVEILSICMGSTSARTYSSNPKPFPGTFHDPGRNG